MGAYANACQLGGKGPRGPRNRVPFWFKDCRTSGEYQHMGGCQNYGPSLDPDYNTAPNILGYPKRDYNFDRKPI